MAKRLLNYGMAAGLVITGLVAPQSATAASVTYSVLNTPIGYFGGVDPDGTVDVSGFNISALASPSAPGVAEANDLLKILIEAEGGYYIDTLEYTEDVSLTVPSGVAIANGSLLVEYHDTSTTSSLGSVVAPSGSKTGFLGTTPIDLPFGTTQVVATINNSLFAFSTESGGESTLASKSNAFFETTVAPIPLPPAVWLLGTALLGLLAVRRNGLKA